MNLIAYKQALAYLQMINESDKRDETAMSLTSATLSDIANFCEFNLKSVPENELSSALRNKLFYDCIDFIINSIEQCYNFTHTKQLSDDLLILIDACVNDEMEASIDTIAASIETRDKVIIRDQTKLIYGMTYAERANYTALPENYGKLQDLATELQNFVINHSGYISEKLQDPDYAAMHAKSLKYLKEHDNKRTGKYSCHVQICDNSQQKMFTAFQSRVNQIIEEKESTMIDKFTTLLEFVQECAGLTHNAIRANNPQVYINHLIACLDFLNWHSLMLCAQNTSTIPTPNTRFTYTAPALVETGLLFKLRSMDGFYKFHRVITATICTMLALKNFVDDKAQARPRAEKYSLLKNLAASYTSIMQALDEGINSTYMFSNQDNTKSLVSFKQQIHDLMFFHIYKLIREDLTQENTADLIFRIDTLYGCINLVPDKDCSRILSFIFEQYLIHINTLSIEQLKAAIKANQVRLKQTIDYKGGTENSDVRRIQVDVHNQLFQYANNRLINGQSARRQQILAKHFQQLINSLYEIHDRYMPNIPSTLRCRTL
jgi:hypothetical protein